MSLALGLSLSNATLNRGVRWDTDALAYINTQSGITELAKLAVNSYVKALKRAGLWSLTDIIIIPGLSDIVGAVVNLKNPSDGLVDAPLGGSIVTYAGFHGDGTSQYLRLPILSNLTLFGSNQDSGFIYQYLTAVGNQQAQFGTTTTANNLYNTTTGGTLATGRLNSSGTALSWSITSPLGGFLITRRSSSTVGAYKDGVNLGDKSSTSIAISTSLRGCIGRNSSAYSSDTFGVFMIGAGSITDQMASDLETASVAFYNTLGSAPPIPTPTILSLVSAQNVPDVSGGPVGNGFTCTGAATNPDGTWYVGDHGTFTEADPAASSTPGIRHISADGSTLLGTVTFSSMGLDSANQSAQGLVTDPLDTNYLYGINKTRNGLGVTKVYRASKSGTLDTSATRNGANGIGYDSVENKLVISGASSINWFDPTTFALSGSGITGLVAPDQLVVERDLGYIWFSSNTSGGGRLTRLTVDGSRIVTASKDYIFPAGFVAVEGFVIDRTDDLIYAWFDGYYHQDGDLKNQMGIFTLPEDA